MTTHELRKKYLDFFKSKGHAIILSASLIPENDPTTLFTGSGMQPMVPFLLGQKHPLGTRIADSQRSFRTQDIEDVGDNRHTTCFEMLGNWSLGDYFKAEQIPWMFEFLTEELRLDPNRLYITVFGGQKEIGIDRDDEAVELWQEQFKKKGIDAKALDDAKVDGMRDGRIFYYDETKNWWSRAGITSNMPVGEPGGPDSEIFWDFGVERKIHENSTYKNEECHVNCDCGRFVEIGNNVFMQYIKAETGFDELSQRNVDFGGGLERMTMATIDSPDIFHIDLFQVAIKKLEELSGKKYNDNVEDDKAFRIIADHLKAATLLIYDGAIPSNVDQGYFTRRLIRRSIRYANQLGITKHFAIEIVGSYIEYYSQVYNIAEKKNFIIQEILKEEEKFSKTLERGIKEFEKMAEKKQMSGEEAFVLFSTYGFPFEMTEELAKESGFEIDRVAFDAKFAKHQELSRQGAEKKFKGGLADHSEKTTRLHTATHLLHAALRKVLGDHVFQKGSNITEERLRFDFSHPEKMTPEQLEQVQTLVNGWIKADYQVSCEELPYDEARKRNVMGLFDDKYGDIVKVYSVGDISAEMCGGPHVTHTGELGQFEIKKEEASSAGVRRIKAILN
ncbi:TPA: alanine--tRNA ligase [Candidatus Falkowbacteria bacterium]|nr:alanine--tRNA ligase [Candidatus Falkowbacteria bacterium]